MNSSESGVVLTYFQKKCLTALEEFLSRKGVAFSAEAVQGNSENYVVLRVVNEPRIEVFIYEDEAGFYLGKEWHPYEEVDFDSGAELLSALILGISRILSD